MEKCVTDLDGKTRSRTSKPKTGPSCCSIEEETAWLCESRCSKDLYCKGYQYDKESRVCKVWFDVDLEGDGTNNSAETRKVKDHLVTNYRINTGYPGRRRFWYNAQT